MKRYIYMRKPQNCKSEQISKQFSSLPFTFQQLCNNYVIHNIAALEVAMQRYLLENCNNKHQNKLDFLAIKQAIKLSLFVVSQSLSGLKAENRTRQ